jgi:hypothetical protein
MGLLLQPQTSRIACDIDAACICSQDATHHKVITLRAVGWRVEGTPAWFFSLLEAVCRQLCICAGLHSLHLVLLHCSAASDDAWRIWVRYEALP